MLVFGAQDGSLGVLGSELVDRYTFWYLFSAKDFFFFLVIIWWYEESFVTVYLN